MVPVDALAVEILKPVKGHTLLVFPFLAPQTGIKDSQDMPARGRLGASPPAPPTRPHQTTLGGAPAA